MPVGWASLLICILKQIISEILWQYIVSQQLVLLWMLQTNNNTAKFSYNFNN